MSRVQGDTVYGMTVGRQTMAGEREIHLQQITGCFERILPFRHKTAKHVFASFSQSLFSFQPVSAWLVTASGTNNIVYFLPAASIHGMTPKVDRCKASRQMLASRLLIIHRSYLPANGFKIAHTTILFRTFHLTRTLYRYHSPNDPSKW